MSQEEFEALLRLWGYTFGERRTRQAEPRSPTGDSPLSRIGQTRTIRTITTMDRGGIARRKMMGAAAGLTDGHGRARVLPAWAAEPVIGSETRTATSKLLVDDSNQIPREVLRVERAALSLHRFDAALGQMLRTEYCRPGNQGVKAQAFGMERKAYRERVAEARGWMRRELAA